MLELWPQSNRYRLRSRSPGTISLVAALTWLSVSCAAASEIFVEQAFPPCVQRGQTVLVTFTGTGFDGTTDLWLSTDTVRATLIAAESTQAQFELVTAPDARPGLYGFRLATHSGLSNLHLFAIDDLATVNEQEAVQPDASNDPPANAQHVTQPVVVVGTSPEADLDHYAIDVEAGQQISFEIVGSRFGKAFDPVVSILDASGRTVRTYDNDPGLFFDFRFSHTFESAGRYVLRLHDTRYHGSPHWTYMLRIGRFPQAHVAVPSTIRRNSRQLVSFPGFSGTREVVYDSSVAADRFYFGLQGTNDNALAWVPMLVSPWPNVVETEPNDAVAAAVAAEVPANLHGGFDAPNDQDWFQFQLEKGTRLVFQSETRGIGSPADIELLICAADGKRLLSSDDSDFEDARLDFTSPEKGIFHLQVSEVVRKSGTPYTYRIEVAGHRPNFSLSSGVTRLTIPRQTQQPLPLTVKRADFDGVIELSLAGAPAGMTLETSRINQGAKELTTWLVVDQSVPLGLQVLASGTSDKTRISAVAKTSPLVDRLPAGRGPHGEAFELREDQRRLPPTVTDRIAVLVVSETPWDFEILEDTVIVPRYVQADFTIHTSRRPGYLEPITYIARGGLLEQRQLQKPSITTTIPEATPETPEINAVLKSGVNTQLERHRVTVTGSARDGARTLHLTRTFELETKTAYRPVPEISEIELRRGSDTIVTISVNRLPQFNGPVRLILSAPDGIQIPDSIQVPSGEPSVDVKLIVGNDVKPGTHSVTITGDAVIGTFLERVRGDDLNVVVPE